MQPPRASAVVGLAARREIVQNGFDRRFVFGSLLVVLIVVAIITIPALMDRWDTPPTIGLHPDLAAMEVGLQQEASTLGAELTFRVMSGDPVTALRSGDIDAFVSAPTEITVRSHGDLAPQSQAVLGAALRTADMRQLLEAQAQRIESAEVLRPTALEVHAVETDDRELRREGTARLATFLLFGQIATYSFWVASGVVEEKSTRVVEVVLSAVRPWQLLCGKVIGLGLLGLAQLLVVGTAALSAGIVMTDLELNLDLLLAVAPAVGGYVLGFSFYASLYAAAASTVSRHEELGSVTAAIQLVLMGSLLASFSALDATTRVGQLVSILPVTAPITLPPRIAAGTATVTEIALSGALLLITTAAVVLAAARLYNGAVLSTGQRVGFLTAWRSGRVRDVLSSTHEAGARHPRSDHDHD